jgi:2-methylisocitrate lyase-like PEP mutase family enzyme
MSDQPSQADKGAAMRALHEGEPFLIPNPWDAGSAKMLHGLGFEALATTSAGFAFTLGRADGDVTLDEVCNHITTLDGATPLPVAADLENGYGREPADAATAITRAAEAGVVGGSIEDWDPDDGLYEAGFAAERIAAAAEAARALDFDFTLTARAENHLRGNPDLDDTIARLRAFEEAGADVLYAPWLRKAEEIQAVCEAVGKPVNALALPGGLPVSELFAAGAQRVSLGGHLAWFSLATAYEAAKTIRDEGDMSATRTEVRFDDVLGERS